MAELDSLTVKDLVTSSNKPIAASQAVILKALIGAEETRAQASEGSLTTSLSTLNSGLTAEINRATAAETAEVTARQNGDIAVLARIDAPTLSPGDPHTVGQRRTWTDGKVYSCIVPALVGETPASAAAKWAVWFGDATQVVANTAAIASEIVRATTTEALLVKQDGSTPFSGRQGGMDGVLPTDLIVLQQLDDAVARINALTGSTGPVLGIIRTGANGDLVDNIHTIKEAIEIHESNVKETNQVLGVPRNATNLGVIAKFDGALVDNDESAVSALGTHEQSIVDLVTLTGVNRNEEGLGDLSPDATAFTATETVRSAFKKVRGNYIPLADLVNDLVTGGTTKPLTAEQGKQLRLMIEGRIGELYNAADSATASSLFLAGKLAARDEVHLNNDGDGKWARYQVVNPGDGSWANILATNVPAGTTLIKLADQDDATAYAQHVGKVKVTATDTTYAFLTDALTNSDADIEWGLNNPGSDETITFRIKSTSDLLRKTDVIDDTTTGGTDVPLSAEQGKTLRGDITNINTLTGRAVTDTHMGAVATNGPVPDNADLVAILAAIDTEGEKLRKTLGTAVGDTNTGALTSAITLPVATDDVKVILGKLEGAIAKLVTITGVARGAPDLGALASDSTPIGATETIKSILQKLMAVSDIFNAWQAEQTADFTPAVNKAYPVSLTGGSKVATPPKAFAAYSAGEWHKFSDCRGSALAGTRQLTFGDGTYKFNGQAGPFILSQVSGTAVLTFVNASIGFIVERR